jgi:CRISPR-associated protein Cas1
MQNRDLQEIPKFADTWSYLYFEYGHIDQHAQAIGFHYKDKVIPVPIENLAVLMLGPGTTVSHEAIKRISESRCLMAWTGEMGVRLYTASCCGTYSSRNLLRQAELWSNPAERERVVRLMYEKRFGEIPVEKATTIEQLRGMEGARVRNTYARLSEELGVEWNGRNYSQDNWDYGDPLNRALSCANACLYGICHAAILACGMSPAIGFVHTGKQLSFVYDIADLYKTEITIPLAFQAAKEKSEELEREVRYRCRDAFREKKIMKRIIPDLKEVIYGRDYTGEIDNLTEGADVAVCS